MKNKTAVEWLVEQLIDEVIQGKLLIPDLIEQAKQLEREQIINAYDAGTFYLEGGLYYKETFENESGI